jgi:L-ascorbate metabolism protein UlaG (beta-lactamase superfamily)
MCESLGVATLPPDAAVSTDADSPEPDARLLRRRRRRLVALLLLGLTLAFALVVLIQAWVPMGKGATGARLERMQSSPQWQDGEFENPEPLWTDTWGVFTGMVSASDWGSPEDPIPVVRGGAERFATPPESGLRVTWLGHSTILVEIDGLVLLTDPVWGERTSPLPWLGPERWYAPPLALDELPPVDAVIVSHDHYDHLDQPTIEQIVGWDARFVAPLGVGAHLEYWGVPAEQIVELDWWERTTITKVGAGAGAGAGAGELELVCVPARHASGRQLFDQNATLWAGYALLGPHRRVYFSGDTGLFPALARIGEELGPFDLTMIEVGAYDQAWPDWHIGPEQAVLASQLVRGEAMLPIHWGLFNLAYHGWTEPIERTVAAARARGVPLATPRPGESFEPSALGKLERWWPEVPWRRAQDYPIISTKTEGLDELAASEP